MEYMLAIIQNLENIEEYVTVNVEIFMVYKFSWFSWSSNPRKLIL